MVVENNNTRLINPNRTQVNGQTAARTATTAFNNIRTVNNVNVNQNRNQLIEAQAQNNVNQLNGNAAQNNMRNAVEAAQDAAARQEVAQVQNNALAAPRVEPDRQPQRYVDPYGINLTDVQSTLLKDLYVSDNNGQIPEDYTFSVRDWYYGRDNKLGVGDVLLVRNGQGNIVDYKFMNQSDIYEINYRENLMKNVTDINRGWNFTANLVDLPNHKLDQPVDRWYWSGYGYGQEKLLAQNEYWDIVERNGNKMMVQRQFNDQGQRINAADAIRDVFNNPQHYAFDCATPMPLINMKTTLDVIGDDDFNRNAGQLLFSSWYDRYDNSYFDGGYNINRVNTVGAGDITVNGKQTLDGEMAMFNPANGDKLKLGGVYYFEKPGDNTSALQGWNTVYLGQNADGSHKFWATSIGAVNVNFRPDGYVVTDNNSAFNGHYLGSAQIGVNTDRLSQWDNDRSGVWNY